ncbi:proline dehydrogenase family protein [Poriferisphaera corsica]|uniref:proline dehydrogenase family protein n=1 Tax=Poriferisphaera corsica TaxID=2528020 RepID=UPI0011A13959|nr:proline dehydrogenase family protein [Poriferisphaera corsica]
MLRQTQVSLPVNNFENRIQEIGADLLEDMHSLSSNQKEPLTDKLMSWSMNDNGFKTQLFRFVDTLPALKNSKLVHDYLKDYLFQPDVNLPAGISTALKAGRFARSAFAMTVKLQVESIAKRFIAASKPNDLLSILHGQWQNGIAFSIDLLGEECLSDDEASEYQNKYLELIQLLSQETCSWQAMTQLEVGYNHHEPRVNLSLKISSLIAKVDSINFDYTLNSLEQAIKPILISAEQNNVFINFDIESYALKNLTIKLFERCVTKYQFHAGIAIQAYLHSVEHDIQSLINTAAKYNRQFTIRLVKGAYWDYEVINAKQRGWPIPVYTKKVEVDASFERMAEKILNQTPKAVGQGGAFLALGSHNVRSISHALAYMKELGLPKNAIELQMLYGMAGTLKTAVVNKGLRLREYIPVGELLPGMAYLVRRLLENTSNESWLHAGESQSRSDQELLASPHQHSLLDEANHDTK